MSGFSRTTVCHSRYFACCSLHKHLCATVRGSGRIRCVSNTRMKTQCVGTTFGGRAPSRWCKSGQRTAGCLGGAGVVAYHRVCFWSTFRGQCNSEQRTTSRRSPKGNPSFFSTVYRPDNNGHWAAPAIDAKEARPQSLLACGFSMVAGMSGRSTGPSGFTRSTVVASWAISRPIMRMAMPPRIHPRTFLWRLRFKRSFLRRQRMSSSKTPQCFSSFEPRHAATHRPEPRRARGRRARILQHGRTIAAEDPDSIVLASPCVIGRRETRGSLAPTGTLLFRIS